MIDWRLESIARHHKRDSFDCGDDALNAYLRRYARRNHDLGVSRTLVAVPDSDPVTILGYFTLSPAAIDYHLVPDSVAHRLPKYDVPVYRLGRLAVDQAQQGVGQGAQLLLAAGSTCIKASMHAGGVAMLIDARNESVAGWYLRFGALPLINQPLTLIIRLDLIAEALAARDTPPV
ncbi:MAG: hypothetical protein WKF81_00100 [Thermomicrobiales bacterium]